MALIPEAYTSQLLASQIDTRRRQVEAAMGSVYNSTFGGLGAAFSGNWVPREQLAGATYDFETQTYSWGKPPKKKGVMSARMELQHEINEWLEDSL